MKTRRLGPKGPLVSAIGLGCMGMSEFYGSSDENENLAVLHHSLDRGLGFWDTADMYGTGANERLLSKVLATRRREVFLATKFAVRRDPATGARSICGRPDYVLKACDDSLHRLGVEVIDLYYQHRVDPTVPIEETVGAMASLVSAGKVRFLGMSEAAPSTIRRAHAVHPITALQTEYSLWSRDPETEILATCRDLGIAFVAYSPLGRGFLTGRIGSPDDLEPTDFRRHQPRLQPGNLERNRRLVEIVAAAAARKGCTAAQLALAWVLARGDDIHPIPGTRRIKYLDENIAATELTLTPGEVAELDDAIPVGAAAGTRYPEAGMKGLNL